MPIKYAQTNLQLYNQLLEKDISKRDVLLIKQGYKLAISLFSARYRGNEKPLICHLVGTASILAFYGADATVVTAGLLHAAYTQGMFSNRSVGMNKSNRERITDTLGSEIEELIAAYTEFPWEVADVSKLLNTPQKHSELTQKLILLRVANALEDHLDAGITYNSKEKYHNNPLFLSNISKLAHQIKQPILGNELLKLFEAQEKVLIPTYLVTNSVNSFNSNPQLSIAHRHPILNKILRLFKYD